MVTTEAPVVSSILTTSLLNLLFEDFHSSARSGECHLIESCLCIRIMEGDFSSREDLTTK